MANRLPLPPLKAIRYFEAAARHLSLTRAAQELNVTHSAVSHQVKALEEFLGVALFRRLNRKVVLTDAGQAYLRPVREAFERLGEASRQVRATDDTLTVSTMPSFAAKWLVPHLGGFREAHPDIHVHIHASPKLVDFGREDVDVAIRYGRGNYPGLRTDHLLSEALFPVCSPRLLEGPVPLKEAADLVRHNLLNDLDWSVDFWAIWLARAGVPDANPRRSLAFNYSNLMLQAAIDGLGVGLAHQVLVADDLAAGRLVRPFDLAVPTDFSVYLVAPKATADRPKIVAFRTWLFTELKGVDAASGAGHSTAAKIASKEGAENARES